MTPHTFHTCSAPNCGIAPHSFRRGMEGKGMDWNGVKTPNPICATLTKARAASAIGFGR